MDRDRLLLVMEIHMLGSGVRIVFKVVGPIRVFYRGTSIQDIGKKAKSKEMEK